MSAGARSRLLAAAPWAAAALLVCLKLPWLFSAEPITGWDTVGHMHLARVYRGLFSSFRSTGYDIGWFQGQPAFALYPPFFYFMTSALDLLVGRFAPLEASFNLAVLLVVLLYCAGFLGLARLLLPDGTDPAARSLLALAGLLIPLTYAGEGVQGAGLVGVLGGTFVSTLGLALTLLAFAALERHRRTGTVAALVRYLCLAGLLFYTHYLSTIFAMLLLALYLAAFRRDFRAPKLALVLLGPAALGAPIIALYLGHRAFSSAAAQVSYYPLLVSLLGKDFFYAWRASAGLLTLLDQLLARLKIATVLATALSALGAALVFAGRLAGRRARFVCGAVLAFAWLALDTSLSFLFPGLSAHWYRAFDMFLTFSSLLAVLAAAWLADRVSGAARRGLPAALLSLLALRLIVWDPVAHEEHTTMNLRRSLEGDADAVALASYLRSLPPQSVILPEVLRSRGRHGSPHWLDALIQDAGHRSALGLTIESSLTPLLTYAYLSRGMGHVFAWGIDTSWSDAVFAGEPPGAPGRLEVLPRYLAAAGVGYVIAQSDAARGFAAAVAGSLEPTFASGPLTVYRVRGALPAVTALRDKPWGLLELDTVMGKRLPADRLRRDFLLHANWVRLNSADPPACIVNLGPDPGLLESLGDRIGGLVIVNAAAEPAAYHSLPSSIRSGLPLILVNFASPAPPVAAVEALPPKLSREAPRPRPASPADPRRDPFRGEARTPAAAWELTADAVTAALDGHGEAGGGAAEVRLSYAPGWKAAGGSPVLQTDLNAMLVFTEGPAGAQPAKARVDLSYRAPLSRLVTLAMLVLAVMAAAAAAAGALPPRAGATAGPRSSRSRGR